MISEGSWGTNPACVQLMNPLLILQNLPCYCWNLGPEDLNQNTITKSQDDFNKKVISRVILSIASVILPQCWPPGWHPLQAFCFHVEGSQNPESSALIKAAILPMGAILDLKMVKFSLLDLTVKLYESGQQPGCNELWTPLWWTPAHNPRSPLLQPYTALRLGCRSSFGKPADIIK